MISVSFKLSLSWWRECTDPLQ